MNYQINNMIRTNQNLRYRNKDKTNKKHYIEATFDESMFNIVKEDDDYKLFKSLESDDKLKLLDIFLEEKLISDDDKAKLISLVTENKIKTKDDIIYDKINKKILNIKILKFNEKTNIYELE